MNQPRHTPPTDRQAVPTPAEADDATTTTTPGAPATASTAAPATARQRHIGIVGLGLIGGSLAIRLADAGCRVSAWNHTTRPYQTARDHGITCMPTLEALAETAPDVLVLCNPLKAMPDILARLAPALRPATTLTDVGSVKGMVREQVTAAGLGANYVGAHPMAGNEHSGWQSADPTLYDNALWAVTVDDATDYARFRAVADMIVNPCRNRIIVIDDATHDRAAAMISHMPHVVATALINELTSRDDRDIAVALAAGSWRDMTRVSLTDPDRTRAMVEEDADNVEVLLRHMSARLDDMATALHDWRTLEDERGRQAASDEIARFFAEGQPFREYKARAAAGGATEAAGGADGDGAGAGAAITLPLGGDWQRTLLESARRGEHVVGFDGPRTAVAYTLSHLE